MAEQVRPEQPIRSFVLRQGRMTPSQRRAFDQHWSRFGLDPEQGICNWEALFPGAAPRLLEIGFGMGDTLLEMALESPEAAFVGIDVHRPGIGSLLGRLAEHRLSNVRLYCADATEVLNRCMAPASLDVVMLLFPDPWPKKRHHKRRLVQPAFVQSVTRCLKSGGLFHLATDWEPYAEQMMALLTAAPGLSNQHGHGQFCPQPAPRPPTKFEQRGLGLGHAVWDLIFLRD